MKLLRSTDFIEKTNQYFVATIGNFDGVHLGHQELLKKVVSEAKKKKCKSLVITFDPHPREFFAKEHGFSKIYGLREKLQEFKRHNIDYVLLLKFDKKMANLSKDHFIDILKNKLNINLLIVGSDFRFGKNQEGDIKYLKSVMDVIVEAQLRHDNNVKIASSLIKQYLSEGDFRRAQELLGKPYMRSARVIHGAKRGKLIGFPTANLNINDNDPIIKGVFAVKIYFEDGVYYGVANWGSRPTFVGKKYQLEVHLFNLNENLYGKLLTVEFLGKIRDEKKFSGVDELCQQIAQDIQQAKLIIKDHE